MFYDVYCQLCRSRGLTPSGAAKEIGFNRASVTVWKNTGKAPKQDLLLKIADYFGVTTEELCAEQMPKAAVNGDEELTGYLEQLSARPELRMLFSVSKDATKADVEQAVAIIEALRRAREGG